MNTVFLLMAEFDGESQVPLAEVSEKYFGLTEKRAKREASTQTLPIPVYRAKSQKSPWLVSLVDLAAWIDIERGKAKTDWEKMAC